MWNKKTANFKIYFIDAITKYYNNNQINNKVIVNNN